jgi:hypothetical protein
MFTIPLIADHFTEISTPLKDEGISYVQLVVFWYGPCRTFQSKAHVSIPYADHGKETESYDFTNMNTA